MPKYKVTTDQGTFNVTLDSEPSSPEQLQSIVQSHLSGGQSTPPSSPNIEEGFPTLGSELGGGLSKLWQGMTLQGAKNPFTKEGIMSGVLRQPAENLVEGALQILNAPFLATGRGVGTTLQDILQPTAQKVLGDRPGLETTAYLASAADAAAQLASPSLYIKALKQAGRFPLFTKSVSRLGEKEALKGTILTEEAARAQKAERLSRQLADLESGGPALGQRLDEQKGILQLARS